MIDYYKSLSSYKGFFDRVNYGIGKINMNINEKVNELENKYKNTIIMILNNGYYEVYNINGRIIHLLMEYKFIKNKSSFPLKSLYRVTEKLDLFNINYCYFDNEKEIYKDFKDNNYNFYCKLALKEEKIEEDRQKLYNYIDLILKDHSNKKEEIICYLEEIIK